MTIQIENTEQLGRYIRQTRKAQGLSQTDLYDLSGLSDTFIREVEKGQPRKEIGKIIELTQALGMKIFIDLPPGLPSPEVPPPSGFGGLKP